VIRIIPADSFHTCQHAFWLDSPHQTWNVVPDILGLTKETSLQKGLWLAPVKEALFMAIEDDIFTQRFTGEETFFRVASCRLCVSLTIVYPAFFEAFKPLRMRADMAEYVLDLLCIRFRQLFKTAHETGALFVVSRDCMEKDM
jgi:hypothetical protein